MVTGLLPAVLAGWDQIAHERQEYLRATAASERIARAAQAGRDAARNRCTNPAARPSARGTQATSGRQNGGTGA